MDNLRGVYEALLAGHQNIGYLLSLVCSGNSGRN